MPDNAITAYFDSFTRGRGANDAVGGFHESQTKPFIRIDTVQHAISAIVRGLDLLPPDPPGFDLDDALRDFVPR